MNSHSLLQGIFLIQGSNLGFPSLQILYHLGHQDGASLERREGYFCRARACSGQSWKSLGGGHVVLLLKPLVFYARNGGRGCHLDGKAVKVYAVETCQQALSQLHVPKSASRGRRVNTAQRLQARQP